MKVNLDEIPKEGLHLDLKEESKDIASGWDKGFTFSRPVIAHINVGVSGHEVLIYGNMETTLMMKCARCLESFEHLIRSDINLTLVRRLERLPEEKELTREELDLSYYEGRELETTDILREQLVLDIPIKPLCMLDCKGLCLRCGANLNMGECGCPKEGYVDPRLARLKGFKVKG